jgi:hypothetical protein
MTSRDLRRLAHIRHKCIEWRGTLKFIGGDAHTRALAGVVDDMAAWIQVWFGAGELLPCGGTQVEFLRWVKENLKRILDNSERRGYYLPEEIRSWNRILEMYETFGAGDALD